MYDLNTGLAHTALVPPETAETNEGTVEDTETECDTLDDDEDVGATSSPTDENGNVSANTHEPDLVRYPVHDDDVMLPTHSGLARRSVGMSQDGSQIWLKQKGQAAVFGLPIGAYVPACSSRVSLPIARTVFDDCKINENTESNKSGDTKTRFLSETKGHRLLQCFMEYVDPLGRICTGRVQLDTQSNVNYCRPDIGVARE